MKAQSSPLPGSWTAAQEKKILATLDNITLRAEKCEHVWAEIMNVRGESMTRTVAALREAGYDREAEDLEYVATDKDAWEQYSRDTFEAHAPLYKPGQLRFLQCVTKDSRAWWAARVSQGAILL
jgi:hypothetical protein